ncbi:MAG: universal stress protein [Anaerolineae bacterium]
MSGVVCAIRGGPDSQPTVERAISLAQHMDLPLYLLFVVDLEFLDRTASSRTQTISKEMAQMGEFILLMAQTKAEGQGVDARSVVRHGHVTEEIAAQCHEVDAAYLVIGRPQFENADSFFTSTLLSEFIQQIEAQTGATVILPEES